MNGISIHLSETFLVMAALDGAGLVAALLLLEPKVAERSLSIDERLVRAWILEELERRYPEVDAALDRWAASADMARGRHARRRSAVRLDQLALSRLVHRIARDTVKARRIVDKWAHVADTDTAVARKLSAADRSLWCHNCAVHGQTNTCEEGRPHCYFCRNFNADYGVFPTLAILETRSYRRLTTTDWPAFENLALAAAAFAARATQFVAAIESAACSMLTVAGDLVLRMALDLTGVTEADVKSLRFDPIRGALIVRLWNRRTIEVDRAAVNAWASR